MIDAGNAAVEIQCIWSYSFAFEIGCATCNLLMRVPINNCIDMKKLSSLSERGAMPAAEMVPVYPIDPICNAGDAAAAGKGGRPKAAHEA